MQKWSPQATSLSSGRLERVKSASATPMASQSRFFEVTLSTSKSFSVSLANLRPQLTKKTEGTTRNVQFASA